MRTEHKYLSLPLAAHFEITNACNHRCIHCYNLDSNIDNRPSQKVSDEIVLSCAYKLIENQIFSVDITGGEPLTNKELTQKLIHLFAENNIRVSLNSNLTLLDDSFIEFIKDYDIGLLTSCPSGVESSFKKLVGIDNFHLFESKIEKLISSGIRCTINMVITKENIQDIRLTAAKMKQLGCETFAATPMGLNVEYPRKDLLLDPVDIHKLISDLIWIEEELKLEVVVLDALPLCALPDYVLNDNYSFIKRKCQAGRTVIAVSCNGDVRPCAHNPFSYGNILQEDLHLIWNKMHEWRSLQFVPDGCKDCSWLNWCNGGCRSNAKALHGEWNKNDIWCSGVMHVSPPQKIHYKYEIERDAQLKFVSILRVRKEDENVYVFYNMIDNVFFMVNKNFYAFIYKLQSLSHISIDTILKLTKGQYSDGEICDAISFLLEKKVLKIL